MPLPTTPDEQHYRAKPITPESPKRAVRHRNKEPQPVAAAGAADCAGRGTADPFISDWFCSPIGDLSCGRSQYYFRAYGVSSPPVTPNRHEDPGHAVSQLVEMARQQGATQLILASFNEPELEKLYLRIEQQFDITSPKIFTGSVPGYEVSIDPDNVPAFSFVATFRLPESQPFWVYLPHPAPSSTAST